MYQRPTYMYVHTYTHIYIHECMSVCLSIYLVGPYGIQGLIKEPSEGEKCISKYPKKLNSNEKCSTKVPIRLWKIRLRDEFCWGILSWMAQKFQRWGKFATVYKNWGQAWTDKSPPAKTRSERQKRRSKGSGEGLGDNLETAPDLRVMGHCLEGSSQIWSKENNAFLSN